MYETRPNDLISVKEAQKLLGVSHFKMASLLKDGTIRYYSNLLDKRVKLVSEAEVLSLKRGLKAA
jgi:predicted HTH domain antitoxin